MTKFFFFFFFFWNKEEPWLAVWKKKKKILGQKNIFCSLVNSYFFSRSNFCLEEFCLHTCNGDAAKKK